jgi:hypothetical protein
MRLDDISNRFVSARGQVKIVAAALIALVGLGAAVWAYTSTRNERNFDRKGGNVTFGSNLSPEQRKQMEADAKAAAEEAEKQAAPRQFQAVSAKDTSAIDAMPEKVSAALANSPAASSITSDDQAALADRVRIALSGMVAGSPDALNASITALGGTPRVNDPSKPPRPNPIAKLMEGAELDMANITVDKPSRTGFGGIGSGPVPGSGQFRVTADQDQVVTREPAPGAAPPPGAPPGAIVRSVRANPGDPNAPAGGQTRMTFNSVIALRTDSFPAVRDFASQNLPAYEVKVPAKLKGSTNATPDMDIGVIMAQAPDGQWQPAGYNIYPKSPDVQTTLMNLVMSAAKESGAKIKTSLDTGGKGEDASKVVDKEAPSEPDGTK